MLSPEHLWLTIHESVGHPTELDRALGYEANFAGTSFVTTDQRGKLQYGSKLMNIVGDRNQPEGLATCGYDDDGVRTAEFDIVKDGRFVGYQTIREQAARYGKSLGETQLKGCSYADAYSSIPFQRMPNVSLRPHDWSGKKVGWEEMIADVKDGVLIEGAGSFSIDQQRYNFQFGGQVFWEIKNGQEDPDAPRRGLPGPHPAVLGQPGHGRLAALLQAGRQPLRREGPAAADQRGQPRVELGPLPRSQRDQHREEDLSFLSDAEAKKITDRLLSAGQGPRDAGVPEPGAQRATPASPATRSPPAATWRPASCR